MAAIRAAGAQRLSEVPELPLMIAQGDSLLRGGGRRPETGQESEWDLDDQAFPAADLLGSGSYNAVVGNPPYITVKDPDDHQLYRSLYSVCRGKYPLTVPFIARFFELARPAGDHAGFVGLLVSNSFMKRDFGRPLIEDFLSEIDLTHVLDTSGAYIPGHGTPTVILLGRARAACWPDRTDRPGPPRRAHSTRGPGRWPRVEGTHQPDRRTGYHQRVDTGRRYRPTAIRAAPVESVRRHRE